MSYCPACGNATDPSSPTCQACGAATQAVSQMSPQAVAEAGRREWLSTLLLCFFLGPLGVHRFYTGHTGIGVIQLLTGGGCGIWYIIDFIFILTGSYRDAENRALKK